ncbi:TPA: hypothetical protein DEO28_01290 [Candidatus Dependentiae bacterium]|nr:MAG: hypothetical protein UR14_C0003G0108 [candidate division TM6 bacterium GW2011_GWE2_31_21]KKP53728.1 MAG: hypothetical protein UR43_C0003G0049 [candidate division TM6 bacterium GW2011_GWF2_33_332]HBS48518.1 hypothetical protein [Candidatus Dependentiae bacterium]HBZ73133.1 hypothetical protein [Candidatus Dependentiae bacterium]
MPGKMCKNTGCIWRINPNGSLSEPKFLPIVDSAAIQIKIDQDIIIATLCNRGIGFSWRLMADGSLSQPNILEIPAHKIKFITANNGIIVTLLDDDTCRVWFLDRNGVLSAPKVLPIKNEKISKVNVYNRVIIAITDKHECVAWKLSNEGNLSETGHLQPGRILDRYDLVNGTLCVNFQRDQRDPFLFLTAWVTNKDGKLIGPQPLFPVELYEIRGVIINNGIIAVLQKDGTIKVWGANKDGNLESKQVVNPEPQPVEDIFINHEVIVTLSKNGTGNIFQTDEKGVWSKIQDLRVNNHQIIHVIIGDNLLIVQLEDYSYQMFLQKDIRDPSEIIED